MRPSPPNINIETANHVTNFLRKEDEMLWNAWKPSNYNDSLSNRWYIIDQWAINEFRGHLYNDHVHYVGNLTFATLHQVLNVMCPRKLN